MTQSPLPPQGPPLLPQSSGKATAALILGILAFPLGCFGVGFVLGLIALILGILAISDIDRSQGQKTGRGKAQAGAILGGISLLLVPVLLVGILVPALGAARRAATKMKNNTQMTAVGKNLILWSDAYYQQTLDFPKAHLSPDPTTFGYARGIPTNSVEDRLGAVVNMGSNALEPAMLINPKGTETAAVGPPKQIVLQPGNVSYALLDAESPEWKNRVNSMAPMACDRQVGPGSHWNTKHWEGSVLWGDTHVTYEMPFGQGTTPGRWPMTTMNGNTNRDDDLFAGGTDHRDALMVNP